MHENDRLAGHLAEGIARIKGVFLRGRDRGRRREIHRGAAFGDPLHGAVVVGPGERDDVAFDAIVLAIDGNPRPGEGPGRHAEGDALLVRSLEIPELPPAVEERVEAQREPVLEQRLVMIEGGAVRGPSVVAVLELSDRPIKAGAFGRRLSHAIGRAHAEEQ